MTKPMIKWLVQRLQVSEATPAGSAAHAGGFNNGTDNAGIIHRQRRSKKVHMKQSLPGHQRQTRFLMVVLGAALILCAIATLMYLNRAQFDNRIHQGQPGTGPVNFYP